ncbi:MAG TPA: glycosyl hydrolase [Acidimicrobiia bacterium]|nr:glycosyl hydrolase [Acidimicrobiia bacterium]
MRTSPRLPNALVARLTAPARTGRPWRAVVLAVMAVAALVPTATVRPASAAGRPGGPLVPASGFYVGAYTKHADGYGQDRQKQAISDLETRLGRRLHIDHNFYSWTDIFPTWRETWDIENDRIPMISWNGENTDAIARGDWDGLISSRAQAVAMLNTPVFIRWFWEMDGNKKQGFISAPSSYQKAWNHIHDIFVAAGAINAVWVWCPNASAFEDGTALKYYPGSGSVDWVCGDGYNFAPKRPGDRWRTFPEIYNGFYTAATKLNKPIMIGEFGVLERNAGEKEQWFHQAHDWVAQHPAIAALVYFNADSTTQGIEYDWRVDTSPSAFEGFRYLYTGPAPVPPATSPAPVTPSPADPVTPTVEGSTPTTTPKQPPRSRPGTTPAAPTDPAVVDVTAAPSTTGAGRAPSPRLTWVLELLRQLEAASVTT